MSIYAKKEIHNNEYIITLNSLVKSKMNDVNRRAYKTDENETGS